MISTDASPLDGFSPLPFKIQPAIIGSSRVVLAFSAIFLIVPTTLLLAFLQLGLKAAIAVPQPVVYLCLAVANLAVITAFVRMTLRGKKHSYVEFFSTHLVEHVEQSRLFGEPKITDRKIAFGEIRHVEREDDVSWSVWSRDAKVAVTHAQANELREWLKQAAKKEDAFYSEYDASTGTLAYSRAVRPRQFLDDPLEQRRWKIESRGGRAHGTIGNGYWVKDVYGEDDTKRLAYIKMPMLMGMGIQMEMFVEGTDALLYRGTFHTRKRVTLNELGVDEFTYTIHDRDNLAIAAGKMVSKGAFEIGFSNQVIQIGEDRVEYSGFNPLLLEKGTLTHSGGEQCDLSLFASRLTLSSENSLIPLPLAAVVALSVLGAAEIRFNRD